jgi:hypothetical protein
MGVVHHALVWRLVHRTGTCMNGTVSPKVYNVSSSTTVGALEAQVCQIQLRASF